MDWVSDDSKELLVIFRPITITHLNCPYFLEMQNLACRSEMTRCFFKIQEESERGSACGEILILGDSWVGCSAVYFGECLKVL